MSILTGNGNKVGRAAHCRIPCYKWLVLSSRLPKSKPTVIFFRAWAVLCGACMKPCRTHVRPRKNDLQAMWGHISTAWASIGPCGVQLRPYSSMHKSFGRILVPCAACVAPSEGHVRLDRKYINGMCGSIDIPQDLMCPHTAHICAHKAHTQPT